LVLVVLEAIGVSAPIKWGGDKVQQAAGQVQVQSALKIVVLGTCLFFFVMGLGNEEATL